MSNSLGARSGGLKRTKRALEVLALRADIVD